MPSYLTNVCENEYEDVCVRLCGGADPYEGGKGRMSFYFFVSCCMSLLFIEVLSCDALWVALSFAWKALYK